MGGGSYLCSMSSVWNSAEKAQPCILFILWIIKSATIYYVLFAKQQMVPKTLYYKSLQRGKMINQASITLLNSKIILSLRPLWIFLVIFYYIRIYTIQVGTLGHCKHDTYFFKSEAFLQVGRSIRRFVSL